MRVASLNVSLRAGAAALLVVALSAAAQDARAHQNQVTVVGRMASAVDSSDVYGVLVAIPALRLKARTDSAGLFRLAGVRTGTYDITFRRIGFHRLARTIEVEASAGLFDLGTFLIPPSAAQLEDLVVSATADRYSRLEAAGFYERSEAGFGAFADIDDIERWGRVDLTHIVRRLPGFRVERNRNYGKPLPPTTTAFGIVVEHSRGMDTRRYLISSRRTGLDRCPCQFVLNGIRMGSTQDFDLDRVNPETIVGVEAYASSWEVPREFNWAGSNCGVILIWTR